jgi:hypothetical protein
MRETRTGLSSARLSSELLQSSQGESVGMGVSVGGGTGEGVDRRRVSSVGVGLAKGG